MIKIENLTKVFSDNKKDEITALKGISLEIKKGDIFGIIGMSGAGKSTLIRCLCMLEEPTKGKIFIDGSDISLLKGKELIDVRRKMGVIFQGYNLLMQKTVLKNVMFPMDIAGVPKDESKKRAEELLMLVGLSDKEAAYPAQLSGGQKQRVAIARALATNPMVLLCDEPTSALDSLTTRSVLELLRDINEKLNVTIVIITHEMSVVKLICNKVAVIDGGAFVEVGETKDIFENPKKAVTKMLLGSEVKEND